MVLDFTPSLYVEFDLPEVLGIPDGVNSLNITLACQMIAVDMYVN